MERIIARAWYGGPDIEETGCCLRTGRRPVPFFRVQPPAVTPTIAPRLPREPRPIHTSWRPHLRKRLPPDPRAAERSKSQEEHAPAGGLSGIAEPFSIPLQQGRPLHRAGWLQQMANALWERQCRFIAREWGAAKRRRQIVGIDPPGSGRLDPLGTARGPSNSPTQRLNNTMGKGRGSRNQGTARGTPGGNTGGGATQSNFLEAGVTQGADGRLLIEDGHGNGTVTDSHGHRSNSSQPFYGIAPDGTIVEADPTGTTAHLTHPDGSITDTVPGQATTVYPDGSRTVELPGPPERFAPMGRLSKLSREAVRPRLILMGGLLRPREMTRPRAIPMGGLSKRAEVKRRRPIRMGCGL